MPFETNGISLNYADFGDGPPLSFIHANGFSAGVYEKPLRLVAQKHHIYALNICTRSRCAYTCETGPARISDWMQLSDELIAFLESVVKHPVVGVGHSFGGVVTLISAVRRPELFTKIVLLDPVLLWPKLIMLIRFMILFGKKSKFPLAIRARKRRDGWKSREDAYAYFRDKQLFASWDDEVLRAYCEVGLHETADGVKLACPPETEAQIFESYPTQIWRMVKKLRIPSTLARGENSDTLVQQAWDIYGRLQPDANRILISGAGHLFPMEKPLETAEIIVN